MTQADRRDRDLAALRQRLSRLSAASLRINNSHDLDTVLQDVLDSARSLTAARYGAGEFNANPITSAELEALARPSDKPVRFPAHDDSVMHKGVRRI